MSTTINKGVAFSFCFLLIATVYNPGAAQQNVLDGYIRLAFKENDGLKQQQFQLEKSLFALKEAKSLFLPAVSLQGSFTRAGGGRTIDFPVGDLLNPVYSTLNRLTESQNFPTLENASILLNPDHFYDAKFRTTLPLINAEIWYNQQIKKELITQQQAAVQVFKRQLVKDIKTAYYQLYQRTKAVEIYQNSLLLVDESIRVNESLYRNGVRNNTNLNRAKAEKQKIEAALHSARNDRKNVQAYFNFLLNQPLETPIDLDSASVSYPELLQQIDKGFVTQREELLQLHSAQQIYGLNRRIQKAHLLPKVNTFLDLGSQGFDWNFDGQSRYYFWGVNLQWDLFGFGRYRYQVQQTEADIKTLQARTDDTEKALQLQLEQAYNNYHTALAQYQNAKSQWAFARDYYQDQSRLYREGQLLYLELLDAQHQFTNAQLQQSVSLAEVQISLAEIERCQAAYPL